MVPREVIMDVQALASEFLGSQHGQDALAALQAQGISADDAQTYLTHAAAAGGEHVEEHGAGLLGDSPGKSFFAAFAAGIVRGDGLLGALGDGAEGVLTGRVAEAIASRAGIDPQTAATIAAAATPFVRGFLKSKFGI
jgi:hypothetical protein